MREVEVIIKLDSIDDFIEFIKDYAKTYTISDIIIQ